MRVATQSRQLRAMRSCAVRTPAHPNSARVVCCSASRTRTSPLQDFQQAAASVALGACLLAGCSDPAQALDNVANKSNKEVDTLRAEGHFQRAYDGHITVQKRDGKWLEVRADPDKEGTVLLRENDGKVFVLQYRFKQLDLSDDGMVHDMFADQGAWEDDLVEVKSIDETGQQVPSISQGSFYEWWRWSAGVLEEEGLLEEANPQ